MTDPLQLLAARRALSIGEAIRSVREACGHSQESLADLLGCARNSLVNWETGRTSPTVLVLDRLREVTGRDAYLLTLEASSMDEVNALVVQLHNLGCHFELSTVTINGRADLWEWKATWTRTLSLPGYTRPFSPLGARAPTLAGVLKAVLDFEAKFDSDEARRLQPREETTRHAQ